MHTKMICIFLFVVADFLIKRVVEKPTSQWNWLHLAGNLMIAYYSFPNFLKTLTHPLEAVHDPASVTPLVLMIFMHCYHIMFFQNLSRADLIHHVGYVFTLGAVAMAFNWGPCQDALLFLMCGLPGGLDYLMLGLVDLEILAPELESKFNMLITTYVRSPLVSAVVYIVAYNLYQSRVPASLLVPCLALIIHNTQSHVAHTVLVRG